MAWEKGHQIPKEKPDVLSELSQLKGSLTDEQARAALGKLLRYNLGFTWQLISDQEMFLPFQEIILNSWFQHDQCLTIAGRGVGKSYLLAVFICLYSIFHPNNKTVVVANNFRRVKDIFGQVEKFLNHPGASLLRQCFELKTPDKTKMSKQNDQYLLNCSNGALVKGLPLGIGENLRGERANVLIIDEGLLVSEHIQDTILKPFLTAKANAGERLRIKRQEDRLIAAGLLSEDERTVFPNNKLIITSSASYKFDYLYKGIFEPYIKSIMDDKKVRSKKDVTYSVMRVSYEAIPEGEESFLDEATLKAVREMSHDSPVFRREYRAEFVDQGVGYFNVEMMNKCTIPDGQKPTVEVYGEKDDEYILAIDPAYGASRIGDYFAMGVYKIVKSDRRIVLVHSYGRAGADIKEHYQYLIYLLKRFNIVYTIIDASGTEFIDGFNESELAGRNNCKLGYLDCDFETEGVEYEKQVDKARSELNRETRNFVYPQIFSSATNRRMNEYLQAGISAGKVWFASRINAHEKVYEKVFNNFEMPFDFKDNQGNDYSLTEFLSDQDDWIEQTKRQLALIEVKTTALGTHQYDLPTNLKKSTNENRARRDNYTCLLLAYYASKHYFDILDSGADNTPIGFTPLFF